MGTRRITYFSSEESIRPGDAVRFHEEKIGEVLVAERSPILERHVGIALLDLRWAHSGIEAFRTERGVSMRTESAPLVNNLSTFLKPGRDAFARRDEIAFPGWKRGREREAS
jgi:glycine cleavage system aminomethyltransferase T